MIELLGSYSRGSLVRFALNFSATEGEKPADIELVEADLRFAGSEKPETITADMLLVGPCLVEVRSDDAGWIATAPATDDFSLGFYVIDLRLTVAGEVTIGPPATFQLTEAVTRRAA
ncbi:hypothetical protein [Sphingobium yanoikuyae]|uniref:hypothetical protein n=1 Tax=Sphingobium yanoikuyae TaxID=13690 RepID=UPI0026F29746|nr:hypothetical protein [Sphingobium yanoikuyae]